MLILQRKKGESLVIDDTTTLSVVEIGSDWVKLAIDAPKSIKILRSELIEAARINHEATNTSKDSVAALTKVWKKLT